MTQVVRPKIKVEELSDNLGKITIEPLERGYGTTIGNSIRRVLLSSVPGAAVTRVRFDGHFHEYDTIKGVKEDILEIILNIKELALRLKEEGEKHLRLDVQGEREVTAGDIETEADVEILNQDLHIATLNEEGRLKIEMDIEPGIGYRPAQRNKKKDSPLGVIPIDSDFSPVKWVNYKVEPARVGERTDYDRLILEVETNRGIKPEEALNKAAQILIDHFQLFQEFAAHPFSIGPEVIEEPEELGYNLVKLEFDRRACNLLESKDVVTLKDLLQKAREELVDIHGFGEKTLQKVEKRLEELGYSLKSERDKEA